MPVQHYSDPFGPFFYMWLFQNASSNDRAQWAYNHRSEISDDRWRDMVTKDAQLEARVKQLEAEKAPRDPKYVPPEMKGNEDLMYSEEFVKAAYNETPNAPQKKIETSWWSAHRWFWNFMIVSVIVCCAMGIVFFFDWKTKT